MFILKKTEMRQKDQSMFTTLIDLFLLLSLELVKLTNRVKDKTNCCEKGQGIPNKVHRLDHTKWLCKCHIVFTIGDIG